MTRLLLALVAGLIISTSAYAEGVGSKNKVRAEQQDVLPTPAPLALPLLNGFYVGAGLGYQWGATEVDWNVPKGTILGVDGLSSQGWAKRLHGGYDLPVPGTPFVVGAVVSYNWGKSEFDVTAFNANVLHASIEQTWRYGGRVGVKTSNGTMIYAGGHLAKAEMNITSPLFKAISRDLDGKGLTAGVEVPIAKNISIALEYEWTRYATENLLPSTAGSRLDVDTDTQAVMAKLNFKLGQ